MHDARQNELGRVEGSSHVCDFLASKPDQVSILFETRELKSEGINSLFCVPFSPRSVLISRRYVRFTASADVPWGICIYLWILTSVGKTRFRTIVLGGLNPRWMKPELDRNPTEYRGSSDSVEQDRENDGDY